MSVTLQDIRALEIFDDCEERWPCGHDSVLILNDGRTASNLDSFQLNAIISDLFASNMQKKINPCETWWSAVQAKEHFKDYNLPYPDMGWKWEPSDVVLNKIFATAVLKQPTFDMEEMMKRAKKYAKDDERLLTYITNILQKESFQRSPKDYMAVWKFERGYKSDYRIKEDGARRFFDQNFKF